MLRYVLLINLLFLIFRVLYVIFYPTDLSPEEAQYWDWSRELDLSYYSKPPMVAYINFISTKILGNTEIGVRINAIVLSFLLSIITFIFVKRIFDEKTAFISSVLPNLFIGFSVNSIIFTTDSPFIFFWALTVISIYLSVESNKLSYWILTGIFAGLSFLSKYPAVFLLPLGILYVYVVKRELLKDLKIYTSVFISFIISLPVLYWNFKHDFVSFKHVSNLSSKGSHFPNFSSFFEFLGGQILLLSLIPFFILLYGWFKTFKEREKRLIFLTVFSLPVFLFFLILALKKRVYANWAGFAYFTGSIIISYYFLKLPKSLKFLTLVLSAFLTFVIHFTPILDKLGMRKLLPPKNDPTKFLVGWKKLGEEVSKYYNGKELIFSNVYQISSELAFYVKGNPRTFVFHTGRMTQYYLWKEKLKKYKGRDAIFVGYGGVPKDALRSFKGKKFLKKVEIYWRGERVRVFYLYKLREFNGEFKDSPKGY